MGKIKQRTNPKKRRNQSKSQKFEKRKKQRRGKEEVNDSDNEESLFTR